MSKKIQYGIKRCFDILFSLLMLICSSPFVLIAMAVIKICSPESPVIFKQPRIGLNGRVFTIYKLRSMTNKRDQNGELLPDDMRLKLWGKIIRKTNLDEIPQVFNVLIGDMSLIGPRPVLPVDVEKFNEAQRHRHDILPGISGWEAVNEKHVHSWEDKMRFDLYYVDHFSLLLDLKIFFMTIFVIFSVRRPDESQRPARFTDADSQPKTAEEQTKQPVNV